MTDPARETAVNAAEADPAAVDLDKLCAEAGWLSPVERVLAAAVEALRERVAEMLPYEKACFAITDWCTKHGRSEITASVELLEAIEASEAHTVELASALELLCIEMEGSLPDEPQEFDCSNIWIAYFKAQTTLASMPAQALARHKALENCAVVLRCYSRNEISDVVKGALEELDALTPESTP